MSIRLNVAAVIVRGDALLLVEFDDETGVHYNLPGGGVEDGETLHQALRREVREETHAELSEIGRLLLIWEYVPQQQAEQYGTQQKVALVFHCTLAAGSEPHFPPTPDAHQTGIRWVALDDLENVALLPALAPQIRHALAHPAQSVPVVLAL